MTTHGVSTTGTVGGLAASYTFPDTGNAGLDAALKRVWCELNAIPPKELAEREAAAARVAANNAEHQRELAEHAQGKAKATADGAFVKAFDAAIETAKGMPKAEAARVVAKATVRFLVPNCDGKTIDRLAGMFARHGSEAARHTGAALAREIDADAKRFRAPLSVLEHRLAKGVA